YEENLAAQASQAYDVLRQGGLILIKGDIGYGLLGHSEESIRRMFRLKGRPQSNPAIVIGSFRVFLAIVTPPPPSIQDWLRNVSLETTLAAVYWLNSESPFWLGLPPSVRRQSSKDNKVAVFLNTGHFAECLVAKAAEDNFLIVGSSANLSSQGNN